MTPPIALYGRIRAQAAWNALARSGLPLPLAGGVALFGVATAAQFAIFLGNALGNVRFAGADAFAGALGALLSGFQLVFAFVVIGSISIRMFDPRKASEIDILAALPLRRLDRFLIQISDVTAVPAAMLATTILPAFALAAVRAGMSLAPATLFVVLSALVCFQPVPALIALFAFVLRFTPPRVLRNRALLFLAFGVAVLPLVPLLSALMRAWHSRLFPSTLFPAGWAAIAIRAAETGHIGAAAAASGAVVATTVVLCAAAYVAFDRVLLEHFDEILARLAVLAPAEDYDRVAGRTRRISALAGGATRPTWIPRAFLRSRTDPALDLLRRAFARKEALALTRDPALQLTLAGLGASAFTFALFGGRELSVLATAATAFLAIYMSACLGLASFSQEGRGMPVLAPLPLSAGEVLRAKLLVNSGLLGLAGFAGGFAFGIALEGPVYDRVASPLGGLAVAMFAALLGAGTAIPLGGLVTAMGALFPRRLLRTGRREISGQAMSFFTALSFLFYASIAVTFAAPAKLGLGFLWMPFVMVGAWAMVAAALVTAAKKAVYRGGFEG